MEEEINFGKQSFVREVYRLSNQMIAGNMPSLKLRFKHNSLTFYGDCMFRYCEEDINEDLYIRSPYVSFKVLDRLMEIYNKEFERNGEGIILPKECLKKCLVDLVTIFNIRSLKR